MEGISPTFLRQLAAWKNNPRKFAWDCFQLELDDQQLQAFEQFPFTKRMSIRSGHGTGKSTTGAVLCWWYLSTRPKAKVVCTAPTARQLGDVLWSEMAKWYYGSPLEEEFVLQKDKIYHKSSQQTWWARAISPAVKASKEEQAETLAGIHGDHLLIIVDESSGVPDPIFVPVEGMMTQEDNRILLLGNMTKNKGYFYDTHFHPEIKKAWTRLHWDSRKSKNVQPSYCEYMLNKYGEKSNVFRIRVAGDPPLEDETTLIPLFWAEQCIDNPIIIAEDEPLYLGVDVARYGEDSSIVLPREGNMIRPWTTFNGLNTIDLGGHILQAYHDLVANGVAIDEIGVGAGVTDWLYKHNLPGLFGINTSNASSDIKRASLLRDELWVMMRDKCMYAQYSFPGNKLPGDTESLGQMLANELSSLTYTFNAHGGIKVESKKEAKRRGIPSPNIADALGLTEYFYNISTRVWGKNKAKQNKVTRPWDKINKQNPEIGRQSWAVA